MPVMPLVRVQCDEGIDLAVELSTVRPHTASMWSRNIDKLSRMAREIDLFGIRKERTKSAGLGYGGEGFTSFSIASPPAKGLTLH